MRELSGAQLRSTARHSVRIVLACGLLSAIAFVLAACGPEPAATPAASTSTPFVPGTSTPEERAVDARVTEFEIWQDYMPVVPKEGAPLYGAVTVEITHTEKLTPQIAWGAVILTQAGGSTVAADVPATLQQQADDQGLLTPGPQGAVFTFGPVTTQVALREGDLIGGTLDLSVGGRQISLVLPETALFFTH